MSYKALPLFYPGQIVTYGSGSRLYKVTRVKQVKFLAIESGTGRSVEGRLEQFRQADNPEDFIEVEKPEENEESAVTLYPGMAVRFKDNTGKRKGVFVLTQETQAGWMMSRLGGKDKTLRWHKVPASSLTLVDEINNAPWE